MFRLLRLPKVKDRIGLGQTQIYNEIGEGRITPPVKLTPRSSAWPEDEIEAIVAAIIRGDSNDARRALVRKLVAQRAALPVQVL